MQTMTLTEYIADPARRAALASGTSSSPDYLWQIATGWKGKRSSPALAIRIETATGGVIRCDDLRPDVHWNRDSAGHVLGYQVRLAPDGGKQIAGNVSSHGAVASRKASTPTSTRVKGKKGEAAHG
jgi:DNA-binding transcriptional regulator YdaS (Cro superfamily)